VHRVDWPKYHMQLINAIFFVFDANHNHSDCGLRICTALCLCLIASTALAADVDPSLCRDIDNTTLDLVPVKIRPWYKFEHAVQACPVYSKQHRFLWWIITINIDFEPWEAQTDPVFHPLDSSGFTRHTTPNPYIIDSMGHELGRLSDAFPTGGDPSRTELYFSQWRDDYPYRITVKVFNARVQGDYVARPLQWNNQTRHYDIIGGPPRDQE